MENQQPQPLKKDRRIVWLLGLPVEKLPLALLMLGMSGSLSWNGIQYWQKDRAEVALLACETSKMPLAIQYERKMDSLEGRYQQRLESQLERKETRERLFDSIIRENERTIYSLQNPKR
jgi:hypothetical protein